MAITRTQQILLQRAASADSLPGSFGSLPAVNSFLVVKAWNWSDTANQGLAATAVSDNQGNTWSAVFTEQGDGGAGDWVSAGIYTCRVATSSGTFTITVNPEGTGNYVLFTACEYAGVMITTPLEASLSKRSGVDGNINPRLSGVIAASAGSLLSAVMVQSPSPTSIAINGGWTQLAEELDSGSYISGEADEQILGAGGNYEAQWTVGVAGNTWIGAIASFKQAGGGAPPPPRRTIPALIGR